MSPRTMIYSVWGFKKVAPLAVAPTLMPRKIVMGRLVDSIHNAALPHQVTQHEHTHKHARRRQHQGNENGNRNGEDDLLFAAHGPQLPHLDHPVLLAGA